jgi:hypothetical protein
MGIFAPAVTAGKVAGQAPYISGLDHYKTSSVAANDLWNREGEIFLSQI